MHWNMLAQKLTDRGPLGFPACEEQYLAWEHRFALIKAHIIEQDPDIIGLIELDSATKADFLGAEFNE